jgi:hypothetical protein
MKSFSNGITSEATTAAAQSRLYSPSTSSRVNLVGNRDSRFRSEFDRYK